MPEPRNMDLAERQEYREYILEELQLLNSTVNPETVDLPKIENAVNNAKEEFPE
jgi:hypothetical protein